MYNLNQNQEQIVNQLLNSLVAYINEFDNNKEFQKNTTESGGVTPHVAKELHDNIKRAFKISGKDYGSDMCCFSFNKPNKVDIEKCLNAMSNSTINNPEEAIGLLMIKFKLSKEDAERYYHGYCGDREFSKKSNFSERLSKCFSTEPYTQTYEVSVALDIKKHPELDPKSRRTNEYLPKSLVDDLETILVKSDKTGFNEDKSEYTILNVEIECDPKDRYEEVTKFIKDKLISYGFDEDKINIIKRN